MPKKGSSEETGRLIIRPYPKDSFYTGLEFTEPIPIRPEPESGSSSSTANPPTNPRGNRTSKGKK